MNNPSARGWSKVTVRWAVGGQRMAADEQNWRERAFAYDAVKKNKRRKRKERSTPETGRQHSPTRRGKKSNQKCAIVVGERQIFRQETQKADQSLGLWTGYFGSCGGSEAGDGFCCRLGEQEKVTGRNGELGGCTYGSMDRDDR
jgi:hypothetical protein